jgi:hypothetical protein
VARGRARDRGVSFGWWINHEGIEIDRRQYVGLERASTSDTERAGVMIACAGWLAECRFHGLAGPRAEDYIREVIDLFDDDAEACDSDVFDAIKAIREHGPDIDDDAIVARFMEFQRETSAVLEQADVWRDIEKLATALIRQGRLSGEDVAALLEQSLAV